MHPDSERHKLFSRRAAIVTGGIAVLLSALAARMYYLQVVEASRYRTLAEENRINLRLLPSPRGRIVDRFGLPMADNQQNYRVLLNAEDARDVEAILDVLGTIIPISAGEKRRILREIRRNRRFVPATVRENLNWQEVARIEVNAPDLPGVNIDVGQSRYYPHGADTAHVLGYVAPVSPGEATGDPLLELPGFRIGKSGIEKIRDRQLRGTGGSLQVEVNAFGHVIRELTRQDGQAGAEVALTIDLELQKFASRRFKGEGGAVVVIDIHNGDVLALTSTPGFDPNDFNKGLSTKQWRALTANSKAPLINKAVSGQFSPDRSSRWWCCWRHWKRAPSRRPKGFYVPANLTSAKPPSTVGIRTAMVGWTPLTASCSPATSISTRSPGAPASNVSLPWPGVSASGPL